MESGVVWLQMIDSQFYLQKNKIRRDPLPLSPTADFKGKSQHFSNTRSFSKSKFDPKIQNLSTALLLATEFIFLHSSSLGLNGPVTSNAIKMIKMLELHTLYHCVAN